MERGAAGCRRAPLALNREIVILDAGARLAAIAAAKVIDPARAGRDDGLAQRS